MFFRFRYFRQARNLLLPPSQKAEVRVALQAFMQEHPVRVLAADRLVRQKRVVLRPAFVLSLLFLVLALGAGTASAAERALPDNAPLYFIKTAINEPVRRALAVTPEAKANVDAALSARRLEEAEALTKADRLTPDLRKRVEERFTQQIEKTQSRISALEDGGKKREADRLNVRLEASLEARGDALDSASEGRSTTTREEVAPVIKQVRERTDALVRARKQRRAERGERQHGQGRDRSASSADDGEDDASSGDVSVPGQGLGSERAGEDEVGARRSRVEADDE